MSKKSRNSIHKTENRYHLKSVKNCEHLSVRQPFILHAVLRAHSMVEHNPNSIRNKRRKHAFFFYFSSIIATLHNDSFVLKIFIYIRY